jgi:tetratricopeptide (TPR) repeat protein
MADNLRIEELRRRVQMDPASIAFAALAEEYRRAGRFEDAVATCEAGLLRHPAYLSARVTLGRALVELGRYDEARAQLEQVLRVAPENLAAIRALAGIHGRAGPEQVDHHVAEPATEQAPTPVPAQAAPAPIPVPLSVPKVEPLKPKPEPPALAGLENFLAAILRAREELGRGGAIR